MASTASRNTDTRPGNRAAYPVAAAATLLLGTLAALDANGRLVPGSDTTGLKGAGLVYVEVDNSAGGAGDLTGTVAFGIYKFNNSATQAFTAADVGAIAYIEDNDTVAKTTTHKVKAGRVIEVEADGVWIDTRPILPATVADAITGAADLAALKPILVGLFQTLGAVK